jgi:hypothetical protein
VALVGLPATGLVAAAELGLPFERLVAIDAPPAEHWATVAGALVGAFDILLLAPPGTARASGRGRAGVRAAEVRRLTARSRERGTVLVLLAAPGLPRTPESERTVGFDPDLRVTVGSSRWEGLGRGHGLLCSRRVTVEVAGRRAAARARRAELWLPDPEGQVRLVDPPEQAPVHLSTVPAAWSDAG